MAQKSKPTDTLYRNLIRKLKAVRNDYQTLTKGYRFQQYELMARAMTLASEIKSDPARASRFIEEFGQAKSKDVVYAAMIFMAGAASEAARKKASKRARALSFLVDELHVAISEIPDAIKKQGGIQALADLAAQKLPRRKRRASLGSKARMKNPGAQKGYQLGVSPKQRARLRRFPHKTRLKMVGYLRAPSDGSLTFEVKKITKLKALDVQRDDLGELQVENWA